MSRDPDAPTSEDQDQTDAQRFFEHATALGPGPRPGDEGEARITDDAPLILTLRLDLAHQARFDALREAHFPRERNHLAAHMTLFHELPGLERAAISARLAETARETPAPNVVVGEPYLLGGGVAFRLVSPQADALRRGLASAWAAWLTPQDRSKGALHVTVQNKATIREARGLYGELLAGFAPSRFVSSGLDLWTYRGGPWEAAGAFDFQR